MAFAPLDNRGGTAPSRIQRNRGGGGGGGGGIYLNTPPELMTATESNLNSNQERGSDYSSMMSSERGRQVQSRDGGGFGNIPVTFTSLSFHNTATDLNSRDIRNQDPFGGEKRLLFSHSHHFFFSFFSLSLSLPPPHTPLNSLNCLFLFILFYWFHINLLSKCVYAYIYICVYIQKVYPIRNCRVLRHEAHLRTVSREMKVQRLEWQQ
jgi:hypothetical protein